MFIYMLILVASVFLGTEILAIATPVAQVTLYRLLSLGLIVITAFQLYKRDPKLIIQRNSVATLAIGMFLLWLMWAFISVIWAVNLTAWMQTMFLLTIGILAITGLYLYIHRFVEWYRIVQAAWLMITFLIIWGYFEITTNIYLFADLSKLDKYGTFVSNPLTRIPITTFENQNDYATMLLAYFPLNITLYQFAKSNWQRIMHVVMLLACSYLIYRSQSRMVLIGLIIYFVVLAIQNFRWDFTRKEYLRMIGLGLVVISAVILLFPSLVGNLSSLYYTGGMYDLSGDTVRLNLWRNGLLFIAQTLGLGVGAGNIETWMAEFSFYPTEVIVNMHNWWLEILVGYGIIVFICYTVMYGLLIARLLNTKSYLPKEGQQINASLIAFLVAYIFASITSANNMLIEWHWVFFGIIISYIKIIEMNIKQSVQSETINKREVRLLHESSHNY